jgi:hypothetical protein
MKKADDKKKYQSFLLRLWMEDINEERVWRISIENPFSGERRGFATLKDLCSYLKKMMTENKNNSENKSDRQIHEGE